MSADLKAIQERAEDETSDMQRLEDVLALLEHIARLNAESARQSEVVRMLTEALERYAGHNADCEWERDGCCACGFDAALKAAAEGATKP